MITKINTDNYECRLQNDEISNIGYDSKWDDVKAHCRIEWSIDFEHRSWGIKGMYINIHYLMLTTEFYNDKETIIRDFVKNDSSPLIVTNVDTVSEMDNGKFNELETFEIIKNMDSLEENFQGTICISDIDIDWKDKTITINF
tara:strand:+ start:247 stop:675 length:429 start_codon:yes stop_codon:yes gene_type:complete